MSEHGKGSLYNKHLPRKRSDTPEIRLAYAIITQAVRDLISSYFTISTRDIYLQSGRLTYSRDCDHDRAVREKGRCAAFFLGDWYDFLSECCGWQMSGEEVMRLSKERADIYTAEWLSLSGKAKDNYYTTHKIK